MLIKPSGRLLYFYIFILLISFMDAAVYWTMRPIWFFIDKTAGHAPLSYVLLALFIISFIYSSALLIFYFKRNPRSRINRLNIILPAFLTAVLTGADAYLYKMLESSQNIVIRNFILMLPYIITFVLIVFFTVIYPNLHISRSRAFGYAAASLLIIVIIFYSMDIGKIKITSGPYIQLSDDSSISILWTTNKKSTGYVEYGQNENNLNKVFSSNNGIIDANTTVHKVTLQGEGRKDFIYRIGSTKINSYYPNNIEYGTTAVSDFKKYSDYSSKNKITFYVLSDIHENTDVYKKFLSRDDYDFVVLNGDVFNSIENRDTILNSFTKPLAYYTKGTKPVYFVRGNHETRGKGIRDLTDYLALPQNKFYYTFKFGPVFAIVLDSGEDKPDSHEEYGHLADFERYRQQETEWLKSLSADTSYKNAKYRMAFVHIPLDNYIRQADSKDLADYQKSWAGILNNMKIDTVFSGHTHTPELVKPDTNKFSFPTFIGGGQYGNLNGYTAIRVEVSNSNIKIAGIKYDGSILFKQEVRKQ